MDMLVIGGPWMLFMRERALICWSTILRQCVGRRRVKLRARRWGAFLRSHVLDTSLIDDSSYLPSVLGPLYNLNMNVAGLRVIVSQMNHRRD